MTPKEKADELIKKYYVFGIQKEGQTLSWYESKQCALIVVNEIISALKDGIDFSPNTITIELVNKLQYWDEVKNELIKL